MAEWQFLSNHGMALLCVARNPESRLRDVADCLEVTERTAHRIVSDLVDDGYLVRKRQGNRNSYELRPDVPMRDPLLGDHWIGELLTVLLPDPSTLSSNGQPSRRAGKARRRRARSQS